MSPATKTAKTYAYLDLIFLIQEAPSILGERSTLGGTISALESGGAGHSVASSDEHHEHILHRLEKITKIRRLLPVWRALTHGSQMILDVYYTPRVRWDHGMEAFVGPELASVALAFYPDPDLLREACKEPTRPAHTKTINDQALRHFRAEKRNAQRILREAREKAEFSPERAHQILTEADRAYRLSVEQAQLESNKLVQFEKRRAHAEIIEGAKSLARTMIQEAHEEWDRVRRIHAPTQPKDIRKKAQRDTMAEII